MIYFLQGERKVEEPIKTETFYVAIQDMPVALRHKNTFHFNQLGNVHYNQ